MNNNEKINEPTDLRYELTEEQNQVYAVMTNKVVKANSEMELAQRVFLMQKQAFDSINEDCNLFLSYVIQSQKLPKADGGYSPQQFAPGRFALTGKAIVAAPAVPPSADDTNKE